MKILNAACTAIALLVTLLTFAQSPSEGYVGYDADGMARSIMNLDEKQFTGTDTEIANQYLVANKSWICGGENGNYLHTFGVLKCHWSFTLLFPRLILLPIRFNTCY